MELFVTRAWRCCSRQRRRRCYIRYARVLSRAPGGAVRAYASPSVACLRTDIFSFRSYWHKGSALVCTYVGTSRRADRNSDFPSKQNDLCARSPRLDLSSLLPPSFDLETPESINGSSDFTFLKCRGVRRSFGNARRIFLGVSRGTVSRDTNYLHRKILSPSFSREEYRQPKSENSECLDTTNTIRNKHFDGAIVKLHIQ